jgi:hypothetical protein
MLIHYVGHPAAGRFVDLHRPSKASLRECNRFLGLPKASGFAGCAVGLDGQEHKGAYRALHLRGLESTENPAGIGVANGENKHSLNGVGHPNAGQRAPPVEIQQVQQADI